MKTITVTTKSYTGLVADITGLLASKGVNISSIHAEQCGTDAFVRLKTEDVNLSLKVLNDNGFLAVGEDTILIRVQDEPGALAKITRQLAEHGVDIRGVNMVQKDQGYNVVAISSTDNEKARLVLSAVLVT